MRHHMAGRRGAGWQPTIGGCSLQWSPQRGAHEVPPPCELSIHLVDDIRYSTMYTCSALAVCHRHVLSFARGPTSAHHTANAKCPRASSNGQWS
eukprot:scaffold322345_cov37-Tisochrysis_lutea.AAC.2